MAQLPPATWVFFGPQSNYQLINPQQRHEVQAGESDQVTAGAGAEYADTSLGCEEQSKNPTLAAPPAATAPSLSQPARMPVAPPPAPFVALPEAPTVQSYSAGDPVAVAVPEPAPQRPAAQTQPQHPESMLRTLPTSWPVPPSNPPTRALPVPGRPVPIGDPRTGPVRYALPGT